jgi:Raf kinase inhibitor-like YbhB/YbcL family protein
VPAGAKELALLVQDPDAPGGTFTHWVIYGVPPTASSLSGGSQGKNSTGTTGWTPPCPPKGSKPHHYVFTLLALSKPLGLAEGASASDVEGKAAGATLAEGRLVGLYSR